MPFVVSVGSGLLTFIVMQARIEAIEARDEKALVETQAYLQAQQKIAAERVKASEEAARRKALDEFLSDVRVEERHYVRKTTTLLSLRKHLVLQERIYFRNIPLSGWIEKEMLIHDDSDLKKLAEAASVFMPENRLLTRAVPLLLPPDEHAHGDSQEKAAVDP